MIKLKHKFLSVKVMTFEKQLDSTIANLRL